MRLNDSAAQSHKDACGTLSRRGAIACSCKVCWEEERKSFCRREMEDNVDHVNREEVIPIPYARERKERQKRSKERKALAPFLL